MKYLDFRKTCIHTVILVQQLSGRNIVENPSFASRAGIEIVLNKHVVWQRRVDAWDAILRVAEQQHQIDKEDYKPRIIANLCREVTGIARK
jgi:hypothetical protein